MTTKKKYCLAAAVVAVFAASVITRTVLEAEPAAADDKATSGYQGAYDRSKGPPGKPTAGNYHKDYLPFKDNKYPSPVFTDDTWYHPPIDHQGYINPEDYYDRLNKKKELSKEHTKNARAECLTCHGNQVTVAHGAYQQWLASAHSKAKKETFEQYIANSTLLAEGKIDEFFKAAGIPKWFVNRVPGMKEVAKLYKASVIDKLGVDLKKLVGENSPMFDRGTETYKVSCIDCHSRPGAEKTPAEGVGIILPTTRSCAVCHPRQWVEMFSELTINTPPYAPGRPSHAAGWISNIAPPWYASNSRELQIGCDMCHNTEVRGCDSCHTRHNFDPSLARHPKACETCHMGPDHPDYETWSSSKHGFLCESRHPDYKKKLVDCVPGKDYPAPTCQYCHMKYKEGELTYVSHNMAAKGIFRMGVTFQDPTGKYMGDKMKPYSPRIAIDKAKEMGETNLGYQDRRDAWTGVCNDCHSTRFGSTYLDLIDSHMQQVYGMLIRQQQQVKNAWDEDLILGKRWNVRGIDTVKDYLGVHFTLEPPGGLWRWFDRAEYTSSALERRHVENWFRWSLHAYKGVAHASPDIQFHMGIVQMWKEEQYMDDEELRLRLLKKMEEKLGINPAELQPFHKRK